MTGWTESLRHPAGMEIQARLSHNTVKVLYEARPPASGRVMLYRTADCEGIGSVALALLLAPKSETPDPTSSQEITRQRAERLACSRSGARRAKGRTYYAANAYERHYGANDEVSPGMHPHQIAASKRRSDPVNNDPDIASDRHRQAWQQQNPEKRAAPNADAATKRNRAERRRRCYRRMSHATIPGEDPHLRQSTQLSTERRFVFGVALRSARQPAATGRVIPREDIADIRRMQRDRCANPKCRCKLNGRGAVDHIRALVNGGTNDRRNLQLLCKSCNSSKRSKDAIIFMQEQGLLL